MAMARRWSSPKGDRQVALAENAAFKSVSFDRNQAEDSLYNWSSLRSQYLAESEHQSGLSLRRLRWSDPRLVLGCRVLGLYLAPG